MPGFDSQWFRVDERRRGLRSEQVWSPFLSKETIPATCFGSGASA